MRMPALIVLAATLLVAPAIPQDKANLPKGQAEESAKKIKELQKERIATLKEVVDHSFTMFKNAQVSYEEVLEAQILLLNAELDATEKESDRIALYKKSLEALKSYEDVAKARAEAARGTATAVLKIKARRLEVEIHLEQAKMKEAKEGK